MVFCVNLKVIKIQMKTNHIIKLLKSNSLHKDAVRTFQYAFIDVSESAVQNLVENLQNYPANTDDCFIAGLIYTWYSKLTKEELIGFKMTDDDYQSRKANNIASMIQASMPNHEIRQLRGKSLLDVGAGDCAMTYLVSKQLGIESCALDIKTEIDWGGEQSSDIENKNEYMAKINRHYFYDGSNLLSVLAGKKFKVVMYNHSLHHFPSFQAQMDSIKQITKILEQDGILFMSEHANCMDDEILDLSHILLNLRYSIDKKKISSKDDAFKALDKFKKEYGDSHYFSKNIIDYMTKNFGFKLVKEGIRAVDDVAKTTFFCFIKTSPENELKVSPRFFDDSPRFTKRLPYFNGDTEIDTNHSSMSEERRNIRKSG